MYLNAVSNCFPMDESYFIKKFTQSLLNILDSRFDIFKRLFLIWIKKSASNFRQLWKLVNLSKFFKNSLNISWLIFLEFTISIFKSAKLFHWRHRDRNSSLLIWTSLPVLCAIFSLLCFLFCVFFTFTASCSSCFRKF